MSTPIFSLCCCGGGAEACPGGAIIYEGIQLAAGVEVATAGEAASIVNTFDFDSVSWAGGGSNHVVAYCDASGIWLPGSGYRSGELPSLVSYDYDTGLFSAIAYRICVPNNASICLQIRYVEEYNDNSFATCIDTAGTSDLGNVWYFVPAYPDFGDIIIGHDDGDFMDTTVWVNGTLAVGFGSGDAPCSEGDPTCSSDPP